MRNPREQALRVRKAYIEAVMMLEMDVIVPKYTAPWKPITNPLAKEEELNIPSIFLCPDLKWDVPETVDEIVAGCLCRLIKQARKVEPLHVWCSPPMTTMKLPVGKMGMTDAAVTLFEKSVYTSFLEYKGPPTRLSIALYERLTAVIQAVGMGKVMMDKGFITLNIRLADYTHVRLLHIPAFIANSFLMLMASEYLPKGIVASKIEGGRQWVRT